MWAVTMGGKDSGSFQAIQGFSPVVICYQVVDKRDSYKDSGRVQANSLGIIDGIIKIYKKKLFPQEIK